MSRFTLIFVIFMFSFLADSSFGAEQVFISPVYHDFGSLKENGVSDLQTFVIANIYEADITLGEARIWGKDRGDFTILWDTCSERTLALGATCSVAISYSPKDKPVGSVSDIYRNTYSLFTGVTRRATLKIPIGGRSPAEAFLRGEVSMTFCGRIMRPWKLFFPSLVCGGGSVNAGNGASIPETLAFEHLEEVMDRFHNTFDIYTDQDLGGNHGYPSGWMGDISALELDAGWQDNCYNGNTCIKNVWTPRNATWAGIMWQEPENNWGTVKDGGYNLTGANEISFWARGENGGEPVDFIVGGITGDYPDSIQPTIHTGVISLTKEWKEYTIDLREKDLTNVIGLFGWITSIDPVFYLDDVKYDKSRLDDLRFLESFETLASIEPDRYIRNASFIYDNALVLLTFLSRGTEDDLRRARILADALVYAQNNDRFYTDGRLRNAYMSGDLQDHQTGKARIPGWWDPEQGKWSEDRFQVSSSTGNMAWSIIALLKYYQVMGGSKYLEASIRLGEWIYNNTYDPVGGYTGGFDGWEPIPAKITWKSTEHNIDVYVAFAKLFELTGDAKWKTRALWAKRFVEAMWDDKEGHFWTGTEGDGVTTNKDPNQIPEDVNTWGLMALGNINNYGRGITWVQNNCYLEADGYKGFDFNTDKDHVWFEGTAHMAVAYQIMNNIPAGNAFLSELEKAQAKAPNNNGKGIVAASYDGLTTGFDWLYYSRLHTGATAWFIFAERGYNPYWGIRSTDPIPIYEGEPVTYTLTVSRDGTGTGIVTSAPSGINCGSDCDESYAEGTSLTLTATASDGSMFSSWNGCDSTSGNICYVTLNVNKSVTANFTANSLEVSYTFNDFSLINVCTYDNNWCGYANQPGKAVIYGEMFKDIELSTFYNKLDMTIYIPCNGWGEGLAGPNGSSAHIIVDDVIKEEKIDATMPYHHGGYYKYEYCDSFSNTFDIAGKTEMRLIIRMNGGARLDFQRANLKFY